MNMKREEGSSNRVDQFMALTSYILAHSFPLLFLLVSLLLHIY